MQTKNKPHDVVSGILVAILVVIILLIGRCNAHGQSCDNLLQFLGEYSTCELACNCDLDSTGFVGVADLLIFLSQTAQPVDTTLSWPLDIVPRWNNFYNDAASGNDGFDLFPTIQNSDLTWNDIKDDCTVTWLIDGLVFWTDYDMIFNQIDPEAICSGTFPCTVRIEYQGYIYERTEPTYAQLFFTEVPGCDFGLSLFDADQAGPGLSFGPAEPFEYCLNCQ